MDPQHQQVTRPYAPERAQGGSSSAVILVRPFTDQRSWEREVGESGRRGNRFSPSDWGSLRERSVSALVTSLVVSSLQCAGHAAFESPENPNAAERAPLGAVLEGQIHSFWLDHQASIALYADISLTLRNPATGDPLWIRDVPEDTTLPIWIGPGGEGGGGVADAENTLREMFIRLFADKEFTSALEAVSNRSSHLPAPVLSAAKPDARTYPKF
jgi:hypothetical protein